MAVWLGVFATLGLASGVAAQGWNHEYCDGTFDVYGGDYANVDITNVKSTADGQNVVLEMQVRGSIEDSGDAEYFIYIGTQGGASYASWSNGVGDSFPQGGNVARSGNKLTATFPQGSLQASGFDVVGWASHSSGSASHFDWAGSAYGGSTGCGPLGGGGVLGNWWLWILIPLIIIVVVVVLVVVLVMRKKKPAALTGPPPPMAPMPGQPYYQPPGQPYYPQAPPPQQYPPPPPGQPPARPPGQ